MNLTKKTTFLVALALLVAGYFSILPARAAEEPSGADSQVVNDLLAEAKSEAHQLEADAGQMEQFARSGLTHHSHGVKLNAIKEDVNKAGKLLTDLETEREYASAWQQKAIDEIRPLLREIADNTEAAIEYINQHQSEIKLSQPPYNTYLSENYKVAGELATLITDYVDYGQHKAHFERLAEQLAVPKP